MSGNLIHCHVNNSKLTMLVKNHDYQYTHHDFKFRSHITVRCHLMYTKKVEVSDILAGILQISSLKCTCDGHSIIRNQTIDH